MWTAARRRLSVFRCQLSTQLLNASTFQLLNVFVQFSVFSFSVFAFVSQLSTNDYQLISATPRAACPRSTCIPPARASVSAQVFQALSLQKRE
jgi:hypothetical protein